MHVQTDFSRKTATRALWFAQFCNHHKLNFPYWNAQSPGNRLLTDEEINMSKEEAQCRAEMYLLENM